MGEHVKENVTVVIDSDSMTQNKDELKELSLEELLKLAAEQGAIGEE